MDLPMELQNRVMEELQSDRSIVFIMSLDGVYLSLLGGANRKLYADGSRLIGKSCTQVLKQEKAEYFQSLIDQVIETDSILEEEYVLKTDDFLESLPGGPQEPQRFHSTIIPFRKEEHLPLEQVLWIIRNITSR